LSDMPWVGALFRTTREEQNEIELLITVTPNFAGSMEPCEVPHHVPGLHTASPTDKELYWRGYIETPVDQSGHGYPGNGLIHTFNDRPVYFESGPASLNGNSVEVIPVPNPAAMSVGPNAPRLVDRSGLPLAPPATPQNGTMLR
jgi:pilus assembly protein CpaC